VSTLSAWIAVDDFWPTLSVSSIVFDPLDPLIMYVGTGEAFTSTHIYRESSGVGMGIFKSIDGGVTWDLLPSTEIFKYITDIEIRNENGIAVIYAGVVSGYYKGSNHQSLPSDGLYRSVNGGNTWLQVLPNIEGSDKPYPVADIEIAADGKIFVGSMRNLENEGGATILHSNSGLIGSWTVFDDYVEIIQNAGEYNVPGRVILAAAPSDANVIYALYGAGKYVYSTGFTYSQGKYILRTDNGGSTWNYRPYPTGGSYYWATLAWHALAAAVDPNDPDHIFIGGLDTYKSSNGGSSWTQVSTWLGMYGGGGDDYVHADIHDIDFKPNSSNELVITTDGGAFYTSNATANHPDFLQKNSNFGSLQFYSCDIHPGEGDERLVGGLQDNGTLYHTGSAIDINDMLSGGDGAYCFIDQDDPDLMLTTVYYNQFYVWYDENYIDSYDYWYSGIFINPMDYDDREGRLYANACEFDGDNNNQILQISGFPYSVNGWFKTINTNTDVWFSHVRVSPYAPIGSSNLFLGTLSGRLYKVENAQNSSPEVTELTSSGWPQGNISCVAIGDSEDELLVTFTNYGIESVWQTKDGGVAWTNKEGNLPDMPIRWALIHPDDNNYAMLATETGIWTTDHLNNADVTWTPDNSGLANVRVDMLQMRMSDYTVVAATHGRGLATCVWDLYTDVEEIYNIDNELSIYPNPSNGIFNLKMDNTFDVLEVKIFAISGKLVFKNEFDRNADIWINLEGQKPGQYIVKAQSGNRSFSKQLLLN